jgi:general secretion pathway protein I
VSHQSSERKPHDAGFSLIEALVALSVFAVAGLALAQLQTQSLRTLTDVESRALAGFVAQNKMVQVLAAPSPPAIGTTREEVRLAERDWTLRTQTEPTAVAETLRIDVFVFEGESDVPLARSTGFATIPGQ